MQASTPSLEPEDGLFVRSLLDASDEVIYFKDLESRFLRVSLGCAQLHRLTQEQMVGLTDHDLFATSHADAARADEQRIIATGEPILNQEEHEGWYDRPDSWVATSKFPLRALDGTIVGTFGISRDITRRVLAERERQLAEAQLRNVLESSTDAIAKYDAALRYQYLNPAGEAARGVRAVDVVGRTDRERGMPGPILDRWEAAIRRVLETGEPGELEFHAESGVGARGWFQTRFGPERDSRGAVVGVLAATRDISAIKAAEQALAHQATHDTLTGLANRSLLMARLDEALTRVERRRGYLAVYFVDIDRFKDTNDIFGHAVGDQVLREVARRLMTVARREDVVARLAGDELVVACENVPSLDEVGAIAERMVQALSVEYHDGHLHVPMSASVGVAVAADASTDAAELLARADAAMYRAKHGGRNGFRVSDASTDLLPESAELERALAQREFTLLYQPLLSLADRRVVGFEALLRWVHPERGVIAPDQFLATAERTGVIRPLGVWVLEKACADLADWVSAGAAPDLFVSVNVATVQLTAPGFPAKVRDALERHGLEPNRLRLEVTEETLVGDAAAVTPVLQRLATLGVDLAVDNFGASVASIARLPRLPVRIVKLDRFTDVDGQREVVAAVVAIAHALGMKVVAGGIEDDKQLADLDTLAFDGGQGYLLGNPMDAAAVPGLLSDEGR